MQASPASVRHKTEALIREGFLNPEPDSAVRVGEPLAVMDPNGTQHSWFVPLEVGGKLAGFAQLLTSLVPMRVSSFQRRPLDYEHCPDVADWTDIHRIATRAASMARQGEQLLERRGCCSWRERPCMRRAAAAAFFDSAFIESGNSMR